MKIVRIVSGLIAATWLIGVLALGVGGTWLTHDQDAAAGVALGAIAVDGNAGVMENAHSFAGGYATGSTISETVRSAEAKRDLRLSCESQEDSDWGAPAECDAIARSDEETYQRYKDEW
jgi:hypothetical protein